ncbi:mevalonate kinase [Blattabacterium cuenoti]|uniref:mevalonate kinase n=1 Tax=Blattabacterium cuenoti TaxID=1653831 RepID=UPI00163BEB35|nr:mevalonate kinase [Blattabacterium cuenoti]
MRGPFFPSKILLFGEYGILENSSGLSVPHNFYKGILKFYSEFKFNKNFLHSNSRIRKYCDFLFLEKKHILTNIDFEKLYEDIQNGLFFYSNIPQEYGIGSSGALVAAIYDKYSKDKFEKKSIESKNIIFLKKMFSQMESFFHKKSSGIDPLSSYLNLPILFHPTKKNIFIVNIPNKKEGKGAIFLLNSKISRKTSSMVKIFYEKLKNDEFKKIIKEEFIKYNEKCIESFLKKDFRTFLKNSKKLSICIFHNFRPMIPKSMWKIWNEGLFHNIHYLKLCGAGGGGFFLGITKNYDVSRKKLKKYIIKDLFRF